MKRASKLVILLVVAALVLGLAGVAGAASFSDIEGSAAANDIVKLNSLEIINGYPDGSFKPEGNITRAEFAKIAVIAAGLKDSADLLQNTPSQFNDVQAGAWYTGWINLAASQGYLKGYPDGTFKPNANITNAEVITVLMRVLGYNDNLAGDWPVDYLVKAGVLGITSKVSGVDANANATRGNVTVLTSATLDENIVAYDKETGSFDEKLYSGATKSILDKNFEGTTTKDVLVTSLNLADGKQKFSGSKVSDGSAVATVTLAADVKINGADSILGIEDQIITYITAKEGSNTVAKYIEVKNYGVVVKDSAKVTYNATPAVTKVEINSKKYDLDANVVLEGLPANTAKASSTVTYDSTTATVAYDKDGDGTIEDLILPLDGIPDEGLGEAAPVDLVRVVLNKDGKVQLVKAMTYNEPAVVKEVVLTTKTIKVKSAGAQAIPTDLDEDDTDWMLVRDGAVASLEDLKANDLLYVNQLGDSKGLDRLLVAMSGGKTGELSTVASSNGTALDSVTVGGTKYNAPRAGLRLSDNGGKDFSAIANVADVDGSGTAPDLFGEEVSVVVNAAGDVQLIISEVAGTESSKQYGVVMELTENVAVPGTTDVGSYIKILKADGSKVTYLIDSDSDTTAKTYNPVAAPVGNKTTNVDEFVEYTLQDSGSINELTVLNVTAGAVVNNGLIEDVDTKTSRISIDDNPASGGIDTWYVIPSDVVVFALLNGTGTNYVKTMSYDELEDYIDASNTAQVYAKTDKGKVEYLVLDAGVSIVSSANLAMVMGRGVDSDGTYLDLDVNGESKRLNTTSGVSVTKDDAAVGSVADINKGDLIEYAISGGKISTITEKVSKKTGTPTVDSIDSAAGLIEIGGVFYTTDKDTVIYSNNESTPAFIGLDEVLEGDKVVFVATSGIIDYIVVKN